MQGFIFDLNDKLGDDGIAALGITEDLQALEDANNEFIAAYNSRATERAEGDTGLTLKLRQEMYALYQQICFITQYLANSTETANAEKAAACQTFIGVLNVLLADAKKRYNQRINNGSDEEGEGGEGHTDSSDSTDDSGSGSGSGEGHTEPTDNGGSGNGSGNTDNSGSDNGNTGNTDNSGSGSGSGSDNGNTGNTDNSGSGNSQGSGSDSGSGSDDNTSDPNQPSEGGVENGDEVAF